MKAFFKAFGQEFSRLYMEIKEYWLLVPSTNPNDPYHRMTSPKFVGERLKEIIRQKGVSIENSEHDYLRGRINLHQYIRELIFDVVRLEQELLRAEEQLKHLDRVHKAKAKRNDKERKNNIPTVGIPNSEGKSGKSIGPKPIIAN